MDLQGVKGTDLQVNLIMQKFLRHRFEILQHLFLLVHLFLSGGCKLFFLVISKDLAVYELQETDRRGHDQYLRFKQGSHQENRFWFFSDCTW